MSPVGSLGLVIHMWHRCSLVVMVFHDSSSFCPCTLSSAAFSLGAAYLRGAFSMFPLESCLWHSLIITLLLSVPGTGAGCWTLGGSLCGLWVFMSVASMSWWGGTVSHSPLAYRLMPSMDGRWLMVTPLQNLYLLLVMSWLETGLMATCWVAFRLTSSFVFQSSW